MLSARLTPHHTDIKRAVLRSTGFFPPTGCSGFGVPAQPVGGREPTSCAISLRRSLHRDAPARPPKGGTPNAGSADQTRPIRRRLQRVRSPGFSRAGEGSRRIALSRSALLHRDCTARPPKGGLPNAGVPATNPAVPPTGCSGLEFRFRRSGCSNCRITASNLQTSAPHSHSERALQFLANRSPPMPQPHNTPPAFMLLILSHLYSVLRILRFLAARLRQD